MATLLLTAVGSAIAGPIGAAIGAMAGQRVDQALFGGKGRTAARLADLAVQSSSYGASIPRIYGRMRVSGTVIWSTDLREERRKVSQGKGRPKATVYSYSASFAIMLSARPAGRIGRIWADGKLLRGSAGDFKVETGFRFHSGAPDQPPDPLIASAEGPATPAYRGRAYAVFEDMALESFGNRIPMLSFEIIADEEDVTTADLVSDMAGSAVLVRSTSARFQGYVADGGSVRAALGPVEAVDPISLRDNGLIAEVGGMTGMPIRVQPEDAGASPTSDALPGLARTRSPSASLPSHAELSFADVSRDYQNGLQSVDLHGAGTILRMDIPAALGADAARRLVVNRLFATRREGAHAELRLPWRCLSVWLASAVEFDGVIWRVRNVRFESMCLVVGLVASATGGPATLPADAGRATSERDAPAGETILHIADLPPMGDASPMAPLIVAAAAGRGAGWRSATLLFRTDDQLDWQEIGGTAAPAVMGMCIGALPASSPYLLDLANRLTVDLARSDMTLLNVDDTALFAGANMALIGGEVIQFGRAERLGPNQWRVSRLLRGRRGTEADIAAHMGGERFLLIDPDALLPLPIPLGNRKVEVLARGVGDPMDVHVTRDISGNALRPMAPVHFRWEKDVGGGLRISWVRRSREGWRWLDLVDAPLGEDRERYRFAVTNAAAPVEFETSTAAIHLSQSNLAEFAAQGLTVLECSIVQIGRFAVSHPLTGTIPLSN